MRVVYLIAGAGGMYCGSCLRDNRLAATLQRQGRDILLIPLYTPIRTDEEDVSDNRLFYGGVNVFLEDKGSLFRHMPRVVHDALNNRRLLKAVGKFASATRPEQLGQLTVDVLRGEDGPQQRELDLLIEGLAPLNADLINLPNLMFLGVARRLRNALKRPIVCALAGEDIFLDALPEPYRSEAFRLIEEQADHVDAFTAPTRYYGAHCADHFGLPASRIHHVPMGITVDDFAPVDRDFDGPLSIGYLARICPEKGLHLLADAFHLLRERGHDVRLHIAGYLGRSDRTYWHGVRAQLTRQRHWPRVAFLPDLDLQAKIRFLQSIHLFSVPTTYPESKGLSILEAMAARLPIVQPNHGVFPELVDASGGGVLHEPHNAGSLANALESLITRREAMKACGHNGHEHVRANHSNEMMAAHTWRLFESVAAQTGSFGGQHGS